MYLFAVNYTHLNAYDKSILRFNLRAGFFCLIGADAKAGGCPYLLVRGYRESVLLTLALEGVCFVFCFLLGENLYCGVEYTRT